MTPEFATANFPTADDLRAAWGDWPGTFPEFMAELDSRQVPYISHSKVATVERCPHCYLMQYVEGFPPKSTALTTGLLFHEVAATFYASRQGIAESATLGAPAMPTVPEHPDWDEQVRLENAVATLVANAWDGHEVLGVEELFFLDLGEGLPAVIGVIDLVLADGGACLVVDHKTCRSFGDEHDAGQLVLYAEHVRQARACEVRTGFFDEYRLVPNLTRVRTPVFRRTGFDVGPRLA